MYEKNETAGTSASQVKVNQPKLIAIKVNLSDSVSKFNELTLALLTKLDKIDYLNETNSESCSSTSDQKTCDEMSFTNEMEILLSRIQQYNYRLEYTLNHLNNLI